MNHTRSPWKEAISSGTGLIEFRTNFQGMCLAIPGKILEIVGNIAKVDFGYGATREVDVTLVDVDVGKYILVHTGYAIQVLEKEDAEETLRLWREMLQYVESGSQ